VFTAGVLPAGSGPAIGTSAPCATGTLGIAINITEAIIRIITIVDAIFVLLIEISIFLLFSFKFVGQDILMNRI
jgi:hypothetical protein